MHYAADTDLPDVMTSWTTCAQVSALLSAIHTLRLLTCLAALGNRIEKWLKTPGDILTFGPRATIGALVALPQRAQAL